MVSETNTILTKQNKTNLLISLKTSLKRKREHSHIYKSGNRSLTYFHAQIPPVCQVVCAFSTHTCAPQNTMRLGSDWAFN